MATVRIPDSEMSLYGRPLAPLETAARVVAERVRDEYREWIPQLFSTVSGRSVWFLTLTFSDQALLDGGGGLQSSHRGRQGLRSVVRWFRKYPPSRSLAVLEGDGLAHRLNIHVLVKADGE